MTNDTTTTATLSNGTLSSASLSNASLSSASLSNSTPTSASLSLIGFGITWQEATFPWSAGAAWSSYSDVVLDT